MNFYTMMFAFTRLIILMLSHSHQLDNYVELEYLLSDQHLGILNFLYRFTCIINIFVIIFHLNPSIIRPASSVKVLAQFFDEEWKGRHTKISLLFKKQSAHAQQFLFEDFHAILEAGNLNVMKLHMTMQVKKWGLK